MPFSLSPSLLSICILLLAQVSDVAAGTKWKNRKGQNCEKKGAVTICTLDKKSGIILGSVLGFFFILVGICFLVAHRKKRKNQQSDYEKQLADARKEEAEDEAADEEDDDGRKYGTKQGDEKVVEPASGFQTAVATPAYPAPVKGGDGQQEGERTMYFEAGQLVSTPVQPSIKD